MARMRMARLTLHMRVMAVGGTAAIIIARCIVARIASRLSFEVAARVVVV